MIHIATIKEVAKYANVSVATVSRVINKKGYVQKETQTKVEEAIKALNYRPNNVARSLFKKQSKMIGYIVPDITNPFFPQLVRAVEDVTVAQGYTTFLCNSDDNLEKELMYLNKMAENYIDGVIIVSNHMNESHLANLQIPVVALDRVFHESIPSVTIDNYQEARRAVMHLVENGCEKIAHISGPENIINSQLRKKAYQDVMMALERPVYISEGHYQMKTAQEATFRLLHEQKDIDAIFTGNDVMAVGALKACTKLGINVPKELQIIGFDGIEWTETVSPEITTIAQPIYEMGKKAATMLLNRINGKEEGQDHIVFPTELKIRETTTH
ncbi:MULTISPECIES: LacI family DNA-binding transcriptional regulator [Cytobacillus]|uniref:LacI family DNA-binding transcriptional regulator n=1 Tax=Cytobacillus TaxID=2675230 RepID=UPI0021E5844C|nr:MULTISPECIES: LacI family DNA-binding transcriptional regulator [Cytobacillus]MDQ0184117.1 LacI family transcriptional regulator [Cytobacillus kochii]MEA1852704.1 LacI family DNA-binding transcriptional regulator [Cytobacillus sp. OWB-43]